MAVPSWRTVLISALLAASCLGVPGQPEESYNLSHLLFLKSSPAGEPLNLELVAYEPNGTYHWGVDLSPATPAGATVRTIQGIAVLSTLYCVCYGVYSNSAIPKLLLINIQSQHRTVVFHDYLPLPSGCQLDTNSDPTIAFGFGGAKPNFSAVVYALLLCGSSRSQYIGLFSFTFYHYLIGAYPDPPYVKGNLTYLGKTAVSPATHGPRRQPATVISQLFFTGATQYEFATLHANAVSTSVHNEQEIQILRFPSTPPLKLGKFEVAYSAPMDQCAVTISSARRVYALCHAATAGSGTEIKIITAGRPSKVIRPIHPGTDFVGLATNTDSPYVYLIHVDEVASNSTDGPYSVEVISKETGRTVYFWKVLRMYTAARPAVAP